MRLSDAEWKVMSAVWEHHPTTAREVLDRVEAETDWAYTTVKTLLARLVAKGAVAAGKRGNRSVYRPLLAQDAARRSAWDSLLERAFDGGVGAFVRFAADQQQLSRSDRDELRRLLAELDDADGDTEPTDEVADA